jgi:hypothetical protein
MSIQPLYNPIHLYTIDTIEDVNTLPNNENSIQKFFWYPNHLIVERLSLKLDRSGIDTNIIDIGCGITPFPKATHLLDISANPVADKIVFSIDLDFDKIPYTDYYFNFAYCRHTLEDIQNPNNAFNEIIRVSSQGYIETPSPLVEIIKGVDGKYFSFDYVGYRHHRYIVWSDVKTNTLYFLPKYPIVEYLTINSGLLQRYYYLLNHYPVYWNNYYVWNSIKPPKIVVYRNGVNMNIDTDYIRLITEAISSSIQYTNDFIRALSTD